MIKLLFALLLIVSVNSVTAQKNRFDTSANKIPALQKTNVPVKNASKIVPKYPDIIITALQVQKGGVSGFYATFTLKNIGNAPVKKGWLSVQGYLNNTAGACGGSSIAGTIAEREQLLNPGESVNHTQTINLTGLTVGNIYTYILCAMDAKLLDEGKPTEKWTSSSNNFQESDITNNQKRVTFTFQF